MHNKSVKGLGSFFGHSARGNQIRPPAVAGTFYPGDPEELRRTVDTLLDSAETALDKPVFGLVAPHAGYIYSGATAAHSYRAIRGKRYSTVIVLSPSHFDSFPGASVYEGDAYSTPLGEVSVDKRLCRRLAESSERLELSSRGHRQGGYGRWEHALEVQLPFLQRALEEGFHLVPILMGDQEATTCRAVATALDRTVADEDILVVASSDLSHFHPSETAVEKDRRVISAIQRWDHRSLLHNAGRRHWEACGAGPIAAAMLFAEERGYDSAVLLDYSHSGMVPEGDAESVVGYASFAFTPSEEEPSLALPSLSEGEESELLGIARMSVESAVRGEQPREFEGAPGSEEAAVFVTLRNEGELRGCIGNVLAVAPLAEAVASAAYNAASLDHRFPSLQESELSSLSLEISILSPFRRLRDLNRIRIGKHGLLIEMRGQRGLLLPQVAVENGWDGPAFLEHACLKASLPADAWRCGASVYVFGTRVIR